MDVRHPLYQAIASILAGILILNPIVAAAAELAVDAAAGGNTSVGAAGNGVPVVNIATPNGAGLSHNRFTDYNVGQQGLILNNATQAQVTQLGGTVDANANLGGRAANKILNEVTGANPSQLRGYTEVAGQSAHVIVANPHGITCDGCGFINTPRATLTTGKPLMDGERLRGYDVDGGEIAIEGAGLNASNVDKFELITRSAKLNAELYAPSGGRGGRPQRGGRRLPRCHRQGRRRQRQAATGHRQLGAGRHVRRGDSPGGHRTGCRRETGRQHGRQRR